MQTSIRTCSTRLATCNFSENEWIAKFARVLTSLKLPGMQYDSLLDAEASLWTRCTVAVIVNSVSITCQCRWQFFVSWYVIHPSPLETAASMLHCAVFFLFFSSASFQR